MKDKTKIILFYASVIFMCGSGLFMIIKANEAVEDKTRLSSEAVNRTLYLKATEDEKDFKRIIETVKDDYYYKGNDTGYWKMQTNESTSIKDGVFVVNITSYENDEKSIEYANRFAHYLNTWFRFTEVKEDWTTNQK